MDKSDTKINICEAKLEQPNKETVVAMLQAEKIAKDSSVKGYKNLDDLFYELKQ